MRRLLPLLPLCAMLCVLLSGCSGGIAPIVPPVVDPDPDPGDGTGQLAVTLERNEVAPFAFAAFSARGGSSEPLDPTREGVFIRIEEWDPRVGSIYRQQHRYLEPGEEPVFTFEVPSNRYRIEAHTHLGRTLLGVAAVTDVVVPPGTTTHVTLTTETPTVVLEGPSEITGGTDLKQAFRVVEAPHSYWKGWVVIFGLEPWTTNIDPYRLGELDPNKFMAFQSVSTPLPLPRFAPNVTEEQRLYYQIALGRYTEIGDYNFHAGLAFPDLAVETELPYIIVRPE